MLTNFKISCNHGFYDWFIQEYVGYHILSWFEVQLLYRQEYLKINNDTAKWTYERRPMFRISSKFAYGNFKFRQRNRIEHRTFELLNTIWRFRSDLRVKYTTGLISFNISPYVTEEVFVSKRWLSRNRLYIGISGAKGRFTPVMYMLMQSDKGKEQWFSRWIFGNQAVKHKEADKGNYSKTGKENSNFVPFDNSDVTDILPRRSSM